MLELKLQLLDSFFHSRGVLLRPRRLLNDLLDGFPCEKQPQINPHQLPETFTLFLQCRRQRSSPQLLLQDIAATPLEGAITLLIFRRQLADQIGESFLPAAPLAQQPFALNQPLKSRIRGQSAEVGELQSKANDPEPRVQKTKETKHTEANPVGRNEHAHWAGIERRPDIVPESGFHGVLVKFLSRELRELRRWALKIIVRSAHLRNSRNSRLRMLVATVSILRSVLHSSKTRRKASVTAAVAILNSGCS